MNNKEFITVEYDIRYVQENDTVIATPHHKLKYFDIEVEHYGHFWDALSLLAKAIKENS